MKISACIPVYNTQVAYLEALIQSIIAQKYSPYEIVICDDLSSVDYSSLIDTYGKRCPIRYFRNEKNLGMTANWNGAVERASGELCIVLGHDDLAMDSMFQSYAKCFEQDPKVVLVSSNVEFIDELGKPISEKTNVNHRSNIFMDEAEYHLSGQEVTSLCMRNGDAIGELSVLMFKTEAFRAVHGYDSQFKHGADFELAVRIAQRGKTAYLNRAFVQRRMHDDNLTWRNLAKGYVTDDRARFFERHKSSYSFSGSEIRKFRTYLIACAAYDILRLPRHKSLSVVGKALSQNLYGMDTSIYALTSPRSGKYFITKTKIGAEMFGFPVKRQAPSGVSSCCTRLKASGKPSHP